MPTRSHTSSEHWLSWRRQSAQSIPRWPRASTIWPTSTMSRAGMPMRSPLPASAGHLGEVLGPEHPNVATSLNNLAELYRAQGRYADAEPLPASAGHLGEGIRPRASPGRHEPQQSGRALPCPGPVCRRGATPQASAGYLEKGLGPEHPDVAVSLNNLAKSTVPRAGMPMRSHATNMHWLSW